jgi:phage terminase large subunit-like protein
MVITNNRHIYEKAVENIEIMEVAEKEQMQKNVEEFDRLQRFMALVDDKESAVYKAMKERYITLKVILTASGINLTELDRIKE